VQVRRDTLAALGLIAPLAVFMLVFFVVPIVMLLGRSAWDPVVAASLPATAQALRGWNGTALPSDAVYAALARDIAQADDAGTLGQVTSRLNYDLPGYRAVIMRTLRKLNATDSAILPDTARHTLVAIDSHWGELDYWRVMARDSAPLTSTYLLHAADHRLSAAGSVVAVDSDQAAYVGILGRTFLMSGVVTAIVLVLGYPLTYWLCSLPAARRSRVMMAILIPFWTSVLVRIAAWMVVLPREGLVNKALIAAHVIASPLDLLYNRTGVYISMVHILLPFMVLPLFSVMRGIPRTYQIAAISLGSHPFSAFWRVYAPQSLPGVVAGSMLVFISALGYYIAPALLGGAGDQMLSYYIAYFTNTTINWGLASALSVLLLAATAVLFFIYQKLAGARPVIPG